MAPKEKWSFPEGEEFFPGRYALSKLGGGYRYEAYLAWDDARLLPRRREGGQAQPRHRRAHPRRVEG